MADLEKPHIMMTLAALKRLNFRVHAPTLGQVSYFSRIIYLCEHLGEGVDWNIVQSTLQGIFNGLYLEVSLRNYRSRDGKYSVRWACG
jgi:hypothetical protein